MACEIKSGINFQHLIKPGLSKSGQFAKSKVKNQKYQDINNQEEDLQDRECR